jgi:N-glycosylase/DNA lyase
MKLPKAFGIENFNPPQAKLNFCQLSMAVALWTYRLTWLGNAWQVLHLLLS